ncbi:hypothetical protein SAMN02745111_01530 [Eubacterium uniforme]|uniref:Uncharacterized protein n=1 Tax=Eubacterium uniforme TaxID=39495 RepID=A0A1T4VSW9_9FIRM|nr:hypothetical protein [Eubacterium uniforme]SKA68092.1 hypothetical protein SAMN02745111_01530 [Eubacterium uniforme]
MKYIKNILRKLTIVAFAIIISLPTLVFAKEAYTTTFNFENFVDGKYRSFDKGDIKIKVTSSCDEDRCKKKEFTIILYRKDWIFNTNIGEVDVKYSGTTKEKWTNMSSGKYKLYLVKDLDGAHLKGKIKITQ